MLRLAAAADIPALHHLIESAYRGDSARRGWTHEADLLDGQRTDPEALAAIIADPAQRMLLLTSDAAVGGCVAITDKGAGLCYVGMLTVAPDRQAAGLGRQLLAAAEQTAATLFAARRIELTVIRQRAALISYYERRGYVATGETRPFPYGDAQFGLPTVGDLAFVVLARTIE